MNDSTTLSASAGECWCMHGHTERQSVGQRKIDGESGERVTQLKWALQQQRRQSSTNAGHLCTTAKRIYTHTRERKRGEKSERSTFICTNTILSSSSHSCFIILPFYSIVFLFSIRALPKQTADLASIMKKSVSPYLTYRDAYPAVTFQMNNTHMQRGRRWEGQGTRWR